VPAADWSAALLPVVVLVEDDEADGAADEGCAV